MIDRILEDGRIKISKEDIKDIMDPKNYIGFAVEQTIDYLKVVAKKLEENKEYIIDSEAEIKLWKKI